MHTCKLAYLHALMHICIHSYNLLAYIHSFIQAFYIAPIQVRSRQITDSLLCRSFTPKRHRQMRVMDLAKVPKRRLERDSDPRPSSRKASPLPMRQYVSTIDVPPMCIQQHTYGQRRTEGMKQRPSTRRRHVSD